MVLEGHLEHSVFIHVYEQQPAVGKQGTVLSKLATGRGVTGIGSQPPGLHLGHPARAVPLHQQIGPHLVVHGLVVYPQGGAADLLASQHRVPVSLEEGLGVSLPRLGRGVPAP